MGVRKKIALVVATGAMAGVLGFGGLSGTGELGKTDVAFSQDTVKTVKVGEMGALFGENDVAVSRVSGVSRSSSRYSSGFSRLS